MKRRFLYSTWSTGFSTWSVDIGISRNERTGVWTLYFCSTDTEAPGTLTHRAERAEDFAEIFDWRGVDIAEFIEELQSTDAPALVALAAQIRAVLPPEKGP